MSSHQDDGIHEGWRRLVVPSRGALGDGMMFLQGLRPRSAALPRRECRVYLRTALQRGVRPQLQDPAGLRLHGDRRRGDRGAADRAAWQHPVGDHRPAVRQRRRDRHAARHHRLRGPGCCVNRGRQDALRRGEADRRRPGRLAFSQYRRPAPCGRRRG